MFNLQQYLDTGDKSLLPDVEPGATIYVPKQVEEVRSGKQTVYVMGEVAKPGAFETRDGATFVDIIANAGGPTRFADTRQIRTIRADGKIENVDLVKCFGWLGRKLATGPCGRRHLRSGEERDERAVLAEDRAHAGRSGPRRALQARRFEWSGEMSIFDLLANAGGPTARADIAHIQILRKDGDRAAPVLFDLDAFLKGGGALQSMPRSIRAT